MVFQHLVQKIKSQESRHCSGTLDRESYIKTFPPYNSKYSVSLFLLLLSPSVCCSGTGNDWKVWLHHGLQHRLHLHRRDLPHCTQERRHGNVLLRCTHWQYHSSLCHLFRYVDVENSISERY